MLLLNRNFAARRADRTHVRPREDVRSCPFPPGYSSPSGAPQSEQKKATGWRSGRPQLLHSRGEGVRSVTEAKEAPQREQ